MDATDLLAFVVKNGASDLHLCSGLPPAVGHLVAASATQAQAYPAK